jgi:PKD domain
MVSVITPNISRPDFPVGGIPHPLNLLFPGRFPNNIMDLAQWDNWETWQVTFAELQQITHVEVLPLLSKAIENHPISAPLLVEQDSSWIGNGFSITQDSLLKGSLNDTSTGKPIFSQHPLTENHTSEIRLDELTQVKQTGIESYSPEIALFNANASETGFSNITTTQIATDKFYVTHISHKQTSIQSSINKFSIFNSGGIEISPEQITATEDVLTQISNLTPIHKTFEKFSPISIQKRAIHNSIGDISLIQGDITQVGTTEDNVTPLNPSQISTTQVGSTEIDIFQFRPTQIDPTQIDSSKVSLPSLIPNQKLISSDLSHNNTSLLTSLYSTAQSIWHSNTAIDLNFAITNLPTGQLAEGTITSYNTNGTPKTSTITIDDDANGVGWFVDSTPQDNSEFTGTDNYLQATLNSPAAGKYDLLTAILHEMGHTLGVINGYSEFDKYVKGGIFTTDTLSTKLTPDGSHLDSTLYPYDLMNTSLKPGVRKLPSAMDWAIINALNSAVGSGVSGVGTVNPAHLTAGALIGITNGDFTTPTTWNTAGATNIINGSATLTEQSQKLSELTQAFIIPTGASRLQFTIIDNHLIPGDTTKTANDAFEVALLDTNTFTPLAGTSIGLNHTDSLLNIQANGTIFKSDKVTITTLNNKQIVTIDVSDITPNTQATLYFNLLGFGAKTSTITIDDVILSSAPPTNTNILKPAQIEEGQSIQFQATETIPGINNPLTYSWNFGDNTTPVTGQTATHTFADNGTYKVALTFAGIDGVITTQTAAVKVDNVAPAIVN